MFVSAAVGFCALTAVIRGLRGDLHMGNYYLDMWRVVVYVFLPASLIMGVLLLACGVPMTFEPAAQAATVESGAQQIARGPVAAIIPIKHLGTNGGGFFGANSAHPFENPTALSNFYTCVNILIFPFSLVIMFGRMLGNLRQAAVIYGVMMLLFIAMITWGVSHDTLQPNPGLTQHREEAYEGTDPAAPGGKRTVTTPAVAGLPVDQELGNLEGKELRFGTSAGATYSAVTTAVTCGSVNCMHDSLNPLAGLTPLTGMWLNCVFGGKGVGLINNPGPHGFSEILYEFSSSSANNGSGFEGLQDTWGSNDPKANNSPPAPYSMQWDIATGLVMLLGRFIPIIAPIAIAGSLAAKKRTPFTVGTLRTDTVTFGFVLLGTVLLVGALLFLPAAVLGPVAEHLGPIPFGG
jgi:K+-transporting ATPase A subunit